MLTILHAKMTLDPDKCHFPAHVSLGQAVSGHFVLDSNHVPVMATSSCSSSPMQGPDVIVEYTQFIQQDASMPRNPLNMRLFGLLRPTFMTEVSSHQMVSCSIVLVCAVDLLHPDPHQCQIVNETGTKYS